MSKIMELAEYYATLREDGVRRELEEAARAALQAEVEKLEKVYASAYAKVVELQQERDALREKLTSVEKDAARYRWLRDNRVYDCEPENYGVVLYRHVLFAWDSPSFEAGKRTPHISIDFAIDAAMQEATK